MTKFEQLDTMLDEGYGYMTSCAVTSEGFSLDLFCD